MRPALMTAPDPVMPRAPREGRDFASHALARIAITAVGDAPGALEAIRSQLAALHGGTLPRPLDVLPQSSRAALMLVTIGERAGRRVRVTELIAADYDTLHAAGLVALHHKGGVTLTLHGLDVVRDLEEREEDSP